MKLPTLLLLLLRLHILAANLAAVLSADADAVVTEAECRSLGFDPSSLSCDTCSLLAKSPLAQFETDCRRCCQRFRPDPATNPDAAYSGFVGRYQLAILRYDPDSLGSYYEEVDRFLKEDRDEVTRAKGSKAFVVEEVENSNNNHYNMGGFAAWFGGMQPMVPPTIHFYKSSSGRRRAGEEPDEEVSLRGFKREDIADMLMTVLPSS